jgi:site-specific recombinase XerD
MWVSTYTPHFCSALTGRKKIARDFAVTAPTEPAHLGHPVDKAGMRLKAIQDLGGWSSMAALQRYLEVSEEERVDAISKL